MAPHEDDKAMDGLLRRNLARGGDHALVCPEPDILAAYFERSLAADETETYELHFSKCARCREQLAALARAPVAAAADGSATNSRWAWLGDWRWLAIPATAALAFAIFGFLWMRPAKETALETQIAPPVALSQPAATPSPQAPPQLDDKGLDAARASTEKRMKVPSVAIVSKAPPLEAQNAPTMKALRSATREAVSAAPAHSASRGAVTAAAPTAKTAQPRQQEVAGNAGIAGSVSEMVKVQPTVPAVAAPAQAPLPLPHPAKPAVVAGQPGTPTAGAADSVSVEAAEVAPATTGGNMKALQATAPKRKKLEDKSQAVAPPPQINGATDDTVQHLTLTSGPLVQMILTPDPAILWRFGGFGGVERSTDGGTTWQKEQPGEGGRVLAGAAPSTDVCWLVGRDGLILVTKDAKNWKKIAPPEATDFVAVSAEDAPSATVTVTAADGRKFATHNGGKKWKRTKE
jgi:hypothetical protein